MVEETAVVELDTMLLVTVVLEADVLEVIVPETAEVELTGGTTLLEVIEVATTLLVVAEDVVELVDETGVAPTAVAE